MKQFVLATLLISCFAQINAQHPYIPTIKEGAVWRYYSYTLDWPVPPVSSTPDTFASGLYSIEFFGDTILTDGKHYKKVRQRSEPGGIIEYCCSFLRDDTIEKKVYWNSNAYGLINLYDYSLELGDTFTYISQYRIISDIDSVQISSMWHKRITLADANNNFVASWIEGIGRIDWDLFSSATYINHNNDENMYIYLVCYQAPEEIFMPPQFISGKYGCGLVDIEDNKNLPNKIEKIYINNGALFIPNCSQFVSNYSLWGIDGRFIKNGPVGDLIRGIPFSYPEGIYVISLSGSQYLSTLKFVK